MNITLSIDDDLVSRARELAQRRSTTLNQMVRNYLEEVVGGGARARARQRLQELWSQEPPAGRSGGRKIRREDAYEGRLK